MAIVGNGSASVSVSIMDRDLNVRTFQTWVDSTETAADIIAWVQTDLIPAAAALINGVPVGYNVSFGGEDNTVVNTSAAEASDVERKAVFQFGASSGAVSKIELPSVDNTHVVDGTNVLNPADAAVIAFKALFVNVATGIAPRTYLGEPFVNVTGTPKKIHRKSSKG